MATNSPTQQPLRALEDLNLKGAAADNPPFTDTLLGVDSPLRRSMFRHGLLFRMGANAAYIPEHARLTRRSRSAKLHRPTPVLGLLLQPGAHR